MSIELTASCLQVIVIYLSILFYQVLVACRSGLLQKAAYAKVSHCGLTQTNYALFHGHVA